MLLKMEDTVEVAKRRCRRVINSIRSLPPSTNISLSCKRTLLRLANSELSFLSRSPSPHIASLNVGHLEALTHILHLPSVRGVSRVCKPVANTGGSDVHVDVVCTLNASPVWFVVSDRNPQHISRLAWRTRIQRLLAAVDSSSALKPRSIILFFSRGLDNIVRSSLRDEFGAFELDLGFSCFEFGFAEELEDEWVEVVVRSYSEACVLEIKVDCDERGGEAVLRLNCEPLDGEAASKPGLGDTFASIVSGMKISALPGGDDLINFDTTALIAIVSGISNGGTDKLLATPESELRRRFKGNVEFVISQVNSEIQNPIHAEVQDIISGRRGIICGSVHSEFKELVSLCGGPNEKLRADQLLKCFIVVPDSPSARMMGLPTTRKLALKNKIVFGTGDHWHAPTLTANMAFVRAVSQTGLSLFTIEHRPRALTGD